MASGSAATRRVGTDAASTRLTASVATGSGDAPTCVGLTPPVAESGQCAKLPGALEEKTPRYARAKPPGTLAPRQLHANDAPAWRQDASRARSRSSSTEPAPTMPTSPVTVTSSSSEGPL
eukprot:10353690-Prorocentrum_lima.AAC.1